MYSLQNVRVKLLSLLKLQPNCYATERKSTSHDTQRGIELQGTSHDSVLIICHQSHLCPITHTPINKSGRRFVLDRFAKLVYFVPFDYQLQRGSLTSRLFHPTLLHEPILISEAPSYVAENVLVFCIYDSLVHLIRHSAPVTELFCTETRATQSPQW